MLNVFNNHGFTLTSYKTEDDKTYFKAKDAATMLNYIGIKTAIQAHVFNEYKFKYMDIVRGGDLPPLDYNEKIQFI
jgi:prophage antirepressor-like protein